MTDTPRSEHIQTRYSTPNPDLDDHRNQPESLPRVELSAMGTPYPNTRRGTLASIAEPQLQAHSDLLGVNDALERAGMISRDFETAIEDDGASEKGRSILPRRNTFRRGRPPHIEPLSRSRESSRTSRSTSPANSVDAFADPRRRARAGTINSTAPSFVELTLNRTISGGTHRRRPTFSENKEQEIESGNNSAEEDVCFPPPEEASKTYTIDYEELEEYVAECHLRDRTPVSHTLCRRNTVDSKDSKRKIFPDLRPQSQDVPKIVTERPSESDFDPDLEKGPDVDEKRSVYERHDSVTNDNAPRWTFFSSEMDNVIHAAELGDLLMPGESFRDLFETGEDASTWWLDAANLSEEEVKVICKAFRVHPLTLEDILQQETREKVELFKNYYFMCFRSFYQLEKDKDNDALFEPVNIYAVVFREGIITFTFCQNPHAANVRKRIGKLRDYISISSDWICYAFIDDIVDGFGPSIRQVEHETEAIEDQVFTARIEDSSTILKAIGHSRKKVMSLIRLLGGKADVIKGFAKRCNEHYSVAPRGDVGLYLSDIQDHVVTMMSNLGHFEKMLSRSHGNYLAQISVENISQGNAINETLGKVTLIATILVPLNLICGLFGMNVKVPGQDADTLGWWFGILGVILCFVTVCMLVAKRMKLI
ncbi:cora-domain-containing protein [Patellaria atrata CBS 101060]|uniref:Cora-domain-containing protein n=1 Tax=Patellaria atrata CBS 101060 TaxID=1346257 RepID=A0A9P4VQ91_9PEZI|nr:cora-domain-containing protein [Patellaria atrata CBS 101060]